MFKTIEVPRDQDLTQFSRLLWQNKVSHRVHIIDNYQVVAVPRHEQVRQVQSLYEQWRRGEIEPGARDSSDLSGYFDPQEAGSRALHTAIRAPVTIGVVLICLVLAALSRVGTDPDFVSFFLYPDFSVGNTIYMDQVLENFTFSQFLRMIAPVFMHVGFLHLAFNMLWFWEFGKRIEAVQPSWALALLVVVLALVSNTVQYLYGGGNNFVGLSGVVYGLLAYIWMWQLMDPRKGLFLPPALIFIMLILLVAITMLDLGFVAHGGHIGGLLAGVVYGALTATGSRVRRELRDKRGI